MGLVQKAPLSKRSAADCMGSGDLSVNDCALKMLICLEKRYRNVNIPQRIKSKKMDAFYSSN